MVLPRRRLERPRVAGGIDLTQGLGRHMRVNLGRRDRGVSEELLDDSDIGATLQEVGGE